MAKWLTADWHIGHARIIQYCKRPFRDVEQMNNTLLNNVNELVMPDDELYNLGDVALGDSERIGQIRSRINCKNVFVVPGNHDKEQIIRRWFTILPQGYIIRDGETRVILSHYAWRVWPSSHHGTVMCFGHSHNSLPEIPGAATFDVGVDRWDYKPINMNQVRQEAARLVSLGPKYVVDHHGTH